MSIEANIQKIISEIPPSVTLVAVSKTHPVERIREAYDAGQRIFGENRVQELVSKQPLLPGDIAWHLIGHLQTNKVKYIAPFVSLIHSVDSLKLLEVINKEGMKCKRVIPCLLQVYIAQEETKFGLDEAELAEVLKQAAVQQMEHVRIAGLMGMASNTTDTNQVRKEFNTLHALFSKYKMQYPGLEILSMGMSSDYPLAIECGSNMIRVGSHIFGSR